MLLIGFAGIVIEKFQINLGGKKEVVNGVKNK
jgi:hypothetical protein